jgi:hypothetical protein
MFNENSEPKNDFGLLATFDIAHGELIGLSPQEAFVLGVEWCTVYILVERREEIRDRPIHPRNRVRVEAMLKRRKITYEINTLTNNKWVYLTVIGDLFPYPVATIIETE